MKIEPRRWMDRFTRKPGVFRLPPAAGAWLAGTACIFLAAAMLGIGSTWGYKGGTISAPMGISFGSWELTATPTPTSTDTLPSPETALLLELTISPYYFENQFGMLVNVCMENQGSQPASDLNLVAAIYSRPDPGDLNPLFSQALDTSRHPALERGEKYCYNFVIPFFPAAGPHYTFEIRVTFTHTGGGQAWQIDCSNPDLCPNSATLRADFDFPEEWLLQLTQTPTPTSTGTGTPTQTVTPSPTGTPTPSLTAMTTATATLTTTPKDTATLRPTNTPPVTPTNTSTPTPTPADTGTPTPTPSPTGTSTPTSTSTDTPEPSATPQPDTPIPEDTATPTPEE